MRILFFGTAAFAIPSLERLVETRHEVVLCVTQPDRPQGRGLARLPSPVKSAARRLGVPLAEPGPLREVLSQCEALNPEMGVVISYGRLIPLQLLKWPRHGMLGVHPSLLPRYRGASPVAWAILHGDQTTGVTVFRLNERVDAGEIVLQRAVSINAQETASQLSARLAVLGAELLLEGIGQFERGQVICRPQDESAATCTQKLTKADGHIDWQASAASIDRLVRGANPWPGAYTPWRGTSLKLWVTSYDAQPPSVPARPGEVLSASATGLIVATGAGRLVIHELQAAGRRRMTVAEFLAGHPIQVGETLGVESGK